MFKEHTTSSTYTVPDENYAEYKVSAMDESGFESFTSEPVVFAKNEMLFQLEDKFEASRFPYTNFSGKGFIEISTSKNKNIAYTVTVEKAGDYLVDIRYSNGSGPWNTDNKCAIRSLQVNDVYEGVFVFPQRGKDEWSDWGFSNSHKVKLHAGDNHIKITFEDWNNNMNVDVNTAMLDYMRVIRVGD